MSQKQKPAKPKIVRPQIVASHRQLRDVTADAVKAVMAANTPPVLFQRGGLLVRIKHDQGGPAIEVMSDAALRGLLARVADWFRMGQNGPVATPPPVPVVRDVVALPELPGIPVLRGLVEAPTFATDGTLLTTPGYHPAAQLWFHNAPGLVVPSINAKPSPDDVKAAVQLLLEELLGDFPFVDEASRAHTVAAMLLPFGHEFIDGPTPLHLFDAPAPGTGKGLLVEMVSIPATGRSVEIMPEGRDEDEWRKRITAALIKGPVLILIDNVRRPIDSGSLAAALTAVTWVDRELGYSRVLTLPVRAVWLATGNNLRLSNEIARRSVWIRTDARVERPWTRTGFRHPDLRGWALKRRADLVHACLTLIQAWVAAGRPATDASLGTFESWAKTMGGVLMVAGIPGFLANAKELYAQAEDETRPWRAFIRAWWDMHKTKTVGVHELYVLVTKDDLLAEVLGAGSERSRRTRLGTSLKDMRDKVLAGYRVVRAGEDHRGRQLYRLEPLPGPCRPTADVIGGGRRAQVGVGQVLSARPPTLPTFSGVNEQQRYANGEI